MQIFYDILHLIWLAGLTYAVFKIWDRLDQQSYDYQQYKPDQDDWTPIELGDEREFELEEQEKRKHMWKV